MTRLADALDLAADGDAALGVAVSGGSDSVALLVAAHEWARARNVRLQAATVDHGLRPEAADEAHAVGSLCASMGIPHATLTWCPLPAAHIAQATARRARHRLLAGWAHERGIGVLALGHTRDDRIETFLMRARAGSNWYGLAGPLPSSASPVWPQGRQLRLVRPLLAVSRDALRAEMRERNLSWIDDPSNALRKHERVRMRALAARLSAASRDRIIAAMDLLTLMRADVMAEARKQLAAARMAAGEARLAEGCREAAVSEEGRLRLLEALVMAAGGGEMPPRRPALIRLDARIQEGRLGRGVTLAGASILTARTGETLIAQAPQRRGMQPVSGPDWDRAWALLADPRAGMLRI